MTCISDNSINNSIGTWILNMYNKYLLVQGKMYIKTLLHSFFNKYKIA